jgi:hypothetical protein
VLTSGALALGPVVAQAATTPGAIIRLFTPTHDLTMKIHHAGADQWTDFNANVYMKAVGARFEIDVRRPSFHRSVEATVRIGGRTKPLALKYLDGWNGLKSAFVVTWRTPSGEELSRRTMTWCPNDGDGSRLSPDSAPKTAFIAGCGTHPFIRGQRWGIDRGWARPVLPYQIEAPADTSGDHLALEISMRADLAQVLEIPESNRTLRFDVDVEHVNDEAETEEQPGDPGTEPGHDAGGDTVTSDASSSPRRAPTASRTAATAPAADTLPDLIALPGYGMSTRNESSADYLDFAATVYNGGPGPLVVDGYRRGSEAEMDAYQMFYRGTQQISSAKVGTMEYDVRHSHQHWHFKDFATYDLVNADHQRVRTSGKEAFCLAPTDAIDLFRPGAAVNPGNGDLGTACGMESSVWVREVLSTGWGDTYTQARAGQSINITTLPNGTYWLRVTANPSNRLREASKANNVSLRRVVIGGTPGERRVWVPNYGVINSEVPATE